MSGSSIHFTFVTFRAAGIRPYEVVPTIQLALNKNPPAAGPLQSALRAASLSQGKLLEGAEAVATQRTTIQMATLRVDKLPTPTRVRTFYGFHPTNSPVPVHGGRLVVGPVEWGLNELYHWSMCFASCFVKKAETNKKYQNRQLQFVDSAVIINMYTGGYPLASEIFIQEETPI